PQPVTIRFEFGPPVRMKKRRHPLLRLSCFIIIILIIAAFVGQLIAEGLLGRNYHLPGDYGTFLYYLTPSGATVLARPWTLVTSMFMHGGVLHMLVNLIVLLSFGPALELRVGRRRFLCVYLGSGILAAAAQLLVIPPDVVVLGASGAILGVMGALTVLAPRTPVLLFFFIPMPLWMATAGFGAISAIFAFTGYGGSVAHLAHLTGITVGLAYGYRIRREERRRMMGMMRFFFPWSGF
ncbi:MAG: rhomboid family intramembrane serine protease, partial [Candidatus Hadarchaeales archaeon]